LSRGLDAVSKMITIPDEIFCVIMIQLCPVEEDSTGGFLKCGYSAACGNSENRQIGGMKGL
jgi:hypothetical protein